MTKIKEFYTGDTVSTVLDTMLNADGTDRNIALTDLIVTFKTAKNDLDDVALFQKTVTIPDTPETQVGEYTLVLTSEDTQVLPSGNVFYDIRHIETGTPDIVTTVANDKVKVGENISDRGVVVFTPVLSVDTRTVTAEQIETLLDARYGGSAWRT
ncbi:MAG: hypothetical protein QM489_00335 [Candidatus Izemoplasma sp.]